MGRGRRKNHLRALIARLKRDESFALAVSSRFLKNVYRDPATGCWEWQRRLHHTWGYGMMALRVNGGDPVPFGAHVLAWILFRGKIVPGHVRAHACDNPSCCNPDHIDQKPVQGNVDDALDRFHHNSWRTKKYYDSLGDAGAVGPDVPF